MKKKSSKGLILFAVGTIMFLTVLISYFASILSGFTPFYESSAKGNAIKNLKNDNEKVTDLFKAHYDNLYEVADKLAHAVVSYDVIRILKPYIGEQTEQFGDLKYFCRNSIYDVYGNLIVTDVNEEILALKNSNEPICTDVYFDNSVKMDCISFYVPVIGSEAIDGIVSIVPARWLISFGEDTLSPEVSAAAFIDSTGKVIAEKTAEPFKNEIGNNFFDFIERMTENSEEYDNVYKAVNEKEARAGVITINGIKYVYATESVGTSGDTFHYISISEMSVLTVNEMTYVRHVLFVIVIALVFLIISLVFSLIAYAKTIKIQENAALMDPVIECGNAEYFRQKCMEIVYSASRRNYLVYTLKIRQFDLITEKIGEDKMTDLLKYIAKTIDNFCEPDETYGYSGDGTFLVLYRYKNENAFRDRISLLTAVSNKNSIISKFGIQIKYFVGACPALSSRKRTMKETIDCAISACELARNSVQLPYVIYNESVNREMEKNSQIETKMEAALAQGEFKVFLQPKYGVAKDKVDSAEALVRWFDPKRAEYSYPVEFIHVFEANGFITKLDHYVYVEVCKYLAEAVEHGDTVVPVSVNVSRVTAIQNDFVSFYIGNKKKYGVPDGLLAIEFTESFAMENYDIISDIVGQLRKAGISCSIDDFGQGYSSFNLLKNVTMDELKLDRFFLKNGRNQANDDKILATMIGLAKELGMKVTQEGVETKELCDKVIAMGIDAIQGYYYAKAIPLEEYKIFLKTNTSLKYKAMVK